MFFFLMGAFVVVSAVLLQFAVMKLWIAPRESVLLFFFELLAVPAIIGALAGGEIGKLVFLGLIIGSAVYALYALTVRHRFQPLVDQGRINPPAASTPYGSDDSPVRSDSGGYDYRGTSNVTHLNLDTVRRYRRFD